MGDARGEPLTPLAEGAAQLHELFSAYMNAGFSRAESLAMVIAVLQVTLRSGS